MGTCCSPEGIHKKPEWRFRSPGLKVIHRACNKVKDGFANSPQNIRQLKKKIKVAANDLVIISARGGYVVASVYLSDRWQHNKNYQRILMNVLGNVDHGKRKR